MSQYPLVHRLFWAIIPVTPFDVQIGNFIEKFAPGARRVRNDRLHVTMGITEDFPDEPTELARTMLDISDDIAAQPFDILVDRLTANEGSVALRPSRRIGGLYALQDQIMDVTRRAGVTLRRQWHFNPHVTLLYRHGVPFSRDIEGFRWRVDELVLIHSLIGLTEHRVLGRWQLRGRDDPQLSLF
jgi:2'-5' RNA ligase